MGAVYGCFFPDESVSTGFAESLQELNKHYGASGNEMYLETGMMFGFRTNTVKKNQIISENVICIGNYIAVTDALLYNREELEEEVPSFNTDNTISDGELLIRYVLEKGYDALRNVNGDFTGAIYDTKTRELVLLRDHMGVRPLFCYNKDGILAFSTDIRGIIGLPGVNLDPDETLLYRSSMGYSRLSLCGTSYAHIYCAMPGAWTKYHPFSETKHEAEVHVYWKPNQKKIRMKNVDAYKQEMRRLISDALERRLKAVSSPVGCELSGGLDSSVLAILTKQLGYEGRYFSWSWSEKDLPLNGPEDERLVIRDICNQEKIECAYAKRHDAEESFSLLDSFKNLDVPYINTRYIGEGSEWLHSEGATAVVSGHGGDEGVSHRANYFELWYHKEYWHFLIALYHGTKGVKWRIPCFVYRFFRQFIKVHPYFKTRYRNAKNIEEYVAPAFLDKMKEDTCPPLTFAYDPVDYLMQGGPRIRLDNTAVQGADVGIQYLFPFLDYRVFDFAVSIPRYLYQNGYGNRWIYRETFKDIMPESLRNVHYKDVPSTRDFSFGEVYIKDSEAKMKNDYRVLLETLNCKPWNQYFDFEQLAKLPERNAWSEEEWNELGFVMEKLLPYVLMQNLKNKLAKNG